MSDIFEDWKKDNFFVLPDQLIPAENHGHIVVLTAVPFWGQNAELLTKWCQEHGCQQQGMTVELPTDELLTLFCLRWK